MLGTDNNWERFGRDNPYFGVLAQDRFAASNIAANRAQFFATGREDVARILAQMEQRFGPLPRGRALDHGCGVGRLVFPLASEFAEVVGLDVSPSMLAEARANAERFEVANARFELADDALSKADGEFDFVNSYMVLQHIPVRRGVPMIARLVDKLRPGGGFHLHMSIRTDRLRSRALWWASHHILGVKIVQNVMAGRPWNAPAMQMNDYPLGRVMDRLARHGVSEVFVATEQHDKFLTLSLVGRKPLTPVSTHYPPRSD